MSVMKYKDPTTGEVKKVGAPKSDTYTKTETDALLQKKVDKDRVVNPNFLDNWYFGNPVDQRKGYVVPPNTPYHAIGDGVTIVGYTTKYETVGAWHYTDSSTGKKWYYLTGDMSKYTITNDYMVRGYTDTGYTLDRWILGNIWTVGKADLSINDGYITLQEGLFQKKKLKRSKMNGRVLSVSALFADGTLEHGVIHLPDEIVIDTSYTDGVSSAHGCVRYTSEDILEYRIEANGGRYVAVKLELGDQQTLAHQENGNWVLNEIPDYGGQLARCQRYFYRIKADGDQHPITNVWTYANGISKVGTMILPVDMARTPTISYSALSDLIVIIGGRSQGDISYFGYSSTGYPNHFLVQFNTSTTTNEGLSGTAHVMNHGYVDFSADL